MAGAPPPSWRASAAATRTVPACASIAGNRKTSTEPPSPESHQARRATAAMSGG